MIDPSRQRAMYVIPLEELELRLGFQTRGQSVLSLHVDHALGVVSIVAIDPAGDWRVPGALPPLSQLPALESITRPRPVRDNPQA